jgi:glycosyltransferase involved in cell wall biosynthesis
MTQIPQIDIVVPVKNEEHDLAPGVTRLVGHLRDSFPFTVRVTIADNGSTDGTWLVARSLAAAFTEVRAVHLDLPGRGRALHEVWSASDAELHYFVGESNNSFGGGSGFSAITSWVATHFKSQTVGGVTVYNLTEPK